MNRGLIPFPKRELLLHERRSRRRHGVRLGPLARRRRRRRRRLCPGAVPLPLRRAQKRLQPPHHLSLTLRRRELFASHAYRALRAARRLERRFVQPPSRPAPTVIDEFSVRRRGERVGDGAVGGRRLSRASAVSARRGVATAVGDGVRHGERADVCGCFSMNRKLWRRGGTRRDERARGASSREGR